MADIRLYFETKIYEYAKAKGLDVAGENWKFGAKARPFLSISMLYAKSFDVTLCAEADSGIFEVKYHGALGVGTKAADEAAQGIMDLFKNDRIVQLGGKPYRSAAFTTDDSYVVVVSIPYVVYATRGGPIWTPSQHWDFGEGLHGWSLARCDAEQGYGYTRIVVRNAPGSHTINKLDLVAPVSANDEIRIEAQSPDFGDSWECWVRYRSIKSPAWRDMHRAVYDIRQMTTISMKAGLVDDEITALSLYVTTDDTTGSAGRALNLKSLSIGSVLVN